MLGEPPPAPIDGLGFILPGRPGSRGPEGFPRDVAGADRGESPRVSPGEFGREIAGVDGEDTRGGGPTGREAVPVESPAFEGEFTRDPEALPVEAPS